MKTYRELGLDSYGYTGGSVPVNNNGYEGVTEVVPVGNIEEIPGVTPEKPGYEEPEPQPTTEPYEGKEESSGGGLNPFYAILGAGVAALMVFALVFGLRSKYKQYI